MLYDKNKAAKVGETCTCPSCGEEFIKTNYQQAFCNKTISKTRCKDYYWNNVTETKRNNTERLSEARINYLNERANEYNAEDDIHPFDSDALGQW